VLKITIHDTPTERKWTLEGRLVGPWVGELRSNWKRTYCGAEGRTHVVDLVDVFFIDKSGERLLRAMAKQGVKFIATSVYTRHVIEQLRTNDRGRRF
jgi:hypothetical protein